MPFPPDPDPLPHLPPHTIADRPVIHRALLEAALRSLQEILEPRIVSAGPKVRFRRGTELIDDARTGVSINAGPILELADRLRAHGLRLPGDAA